jgi:hypothetical protein
VVCNAIYSLSSYSDERNAPQADSTRRVPPRFQMVSGLFGLGEHEKRSRIKNMTSVNRSSCVVQLRSGVDRSGWEAAPSTSL